MLTRPIPAPNSSSAPTPRRHRAKYESGTVEAESLLWRAVLGQAVRDIWHRDEKLRRDAIQWMGTKDFATVCDLAFVEPESMREQMANLVTLPHALARKYGYALCANVLGEYED